MTTQTLEDHPPPDGLLTGEEIVHGLRNLGFRMAECLETDNEFGFCLGPEELETVNLAIVALGGRPVSLNDSTPMLEDPVDELVDETPF